MHEESLDIDQLRRLVLEETKFRDSLEEHCNELAAAIAELEEQIKSDNNQNSEWKTRYEIQQEMNEQLRKQSKVMQERVEKAARISHDFKKSARANAPPDSFGPATAGAAIALEKEKRSLANQLANIELRVDQEAKAYHKANEERKAVHVEIDSVNARITALKMAPTAVGATNGGREAADSGSRQASQRSAGKSVSIGQRNIPLNQRVLDPKKGPIKKTAAVKQLPPL